MRENIIAAALSRRRAFGYGAGLAGGLAMSSLVRPAFADTDADNDSDSDKSGGDADDASKSLPIAQMNQILQAEGTPDEKVLGYTFTRGDLQGTLPGGIKVSPATLLSGDVYIQSIGNNRAILNGDFCLTTTSSRSSSGRICARPARLTSLQRRFGADSIFAT